jgi:PAS domain S-box-containing protein
VLALTPAADETFREHFWSWLLLTALFGLMEAADLSFHEESGGRLGLSASEALLLPMLVGLSLSEVVLGATIAIAAVRTLRWKSGWWKGLFNVAQYGCAAAAAAGVYNLLADPGAPFTAAKAGAGVVAALVFAVMSHLFTAIVLSLSTRQSLLKVSQSVGSATLWNIAGSISIGILFAASYVSAEWTVVLFVLPLAALYLGFRAVLRQSRERERMENLHAASRALASSPTLENALDGFLLTVPDMVQAAEARVVVLRKKQWFASAVRSGEVKEHLEPAHDGIYPSLITTFEQSPDPIIVGEDDEGDWRPRLEDMGVRHMIAVPLLNEDLVVGCLMAFDRVGAEEFDRSDARLLESLANELVLTLDSYRLFDEVLEERERFGRIFTGSKEGICLINEDGVIQAWNPALARITGYEENEVLGQRWADKVMIRNRNHQRIDGMGIVSVSPDEELEVVTKQGPARWVTTISGQVQAGEERSWVVLVRDITREHELEEAKSDFLSTVSHELRTPLTTIKGSLQVLSRPNADPSSEMGKQMVAIMKRGSDRLERLVMNLLAVSQLEMGDVQVFPDEINMQELIKSRIDTVLPDHAQVDLNVEEEIIVRADRERLTQVVEHLLDNARKFGGEEGKITIAVTKENGFARVTVSDEGPGIPKIDQDRIFERFVRLGHVLTRETQGPGIGLFIAKRSIEAMGGSISVDSTPDEGARFHVRVPLARPMAVTGADATG